MKKTTLALGGRRIRAPGWKLAMSPSLKDEMTLIYDTITGKTRRTVLYPNAPMKIEIRDLDFPCQPTSKSAAFFASIVTPLKEAGEGDVVAIGFPACSTAGGKSTYGICHPIPEVAIMTRGRVSLATEEGVCPEKMSRINRWIRQGIQDPHMVAAGLSACDALKDSLDTKLHHLGMIAWFFSEFVLATPWSHNVSHRIVLRSPFGSSEEGQGGLFEAVETFFRLNNITPPLLRAARAP